MSKSEELSEDLQLCTVAVQKMRTDYKATSKFFKVRVAQCNTSSKRTKSSTPSQRVWWEVKSNPCTFKKGLMSRDGPLLSSYMNKKAEAMDPYVLCYYTTVE
ncbi:hypothetical protein MHYP_G00262350 [Metynnis hypsauchen]